MLRTEGRTVMISGANRGLGNALARRLHDDGYNVSCGARDVAALTAALPAPDERLSFHPYDATDSSTADAWLAATVEHFGGLDALINNAGIADPSPLLDLTDESLDDMWQVNVKGPFHLTRAAMPYLSASGSGRVINLSSLSGLRVKGTFGAGYAMTKFAVTALTEATKNAGWDDGIRVTALCPGYVDTDMTAEFDFDAEDMIRPDDLAELVATVLRLPNSASVARLTVACELEPGF